MWKYMCLQLKNSHERIRIGKGKSPKALRSLDWHIQQENHGKTKQNSVSKGKRRTNIRSCPQISTCASEHVCVYIHTCLHLTQNMHTHKKINERKKENKYYLFVVVSWLGSFVSLLWSSKPFTKACLIFYTRQLCLVYKMISDFIFKWF